MSGRFDKYRKWAFVSYNINTGERLNYARASLPYRPPNIGQFDDSFVKCGWVDITDYLNEMKKSKTLH